MWSIRTLRFAIALLMAGAPISAGATPSFFVTDIGSLGGSTISRDMNASGQVTGYSVTPTGDHHAFIYSGGAITDLQSGGGCCTEGFGINNAGSVVGRSLISGSSNYNAVLFSGGVTTNLGTFGGSSAYATGISASGAIAIFKDPGSAGMRGLIYQGGSTTDIGTAGGTFTAALAMNESGQVTGLSQFTNSGSIDFYHAFKYSDPTLSDLGALGGASRNSDGRDISDAGLVAGSADNSSRTVVHAVYWDAGGIHELGPLPGWLGTEGSGINDLGDVVGALNNPAVAHAMAYLSGTMYDLNDLIAPSDPLFGKIILSDAVRINDAGQILAHGCFIGENCWLQTVFVTDCPDTYVCRSFILTPVNSPENVPEPMSAVLLLMGCLLFLYVRLRTQSSGRPPTRIANP